MREIQKPVLTLIVPIYKAEKYIEDAVNSIKKQTLEEFECFMVDDGSPDKSGELADLYTKDDERFTVIHTTNGGPSRARNVGIENANSPLIVFIDIDDTISNDYLESLYREFDEAGGDILIQGMIKKQDGINTPITLKDKIYKIENGSFPLLFDDVWLSDFGGPCCKCFSTSIINNNNLRFSDNILYAEDYDFLLRYLCHCRQIITSSVANYTYMLRPGTAATSYHAFGLELSGLLQIFGTYHSFCKLYHSERITEQKNKCLLDYTWRVFFANYKSDYSFRRTLSNLRSIPHEVSRFFGANYVPSSVFTKMVKFLFAKRCFFTLNILLKCRL